MVDPAGLEGGECPVRLGPCRPEQPQVLEAEHVPLSFNTRLSSGNMIRVEVGFDSLGRRVTHHPSRVHPDDPAMRPRDHELVRAR